MSKIKIQKIGANELLVSLANDIPMELVNELSKNLSAKGMIEDLSKSTLSERYFFRSENKAADIADQLIKSLEDMSKGKKHWWADSSADVDAWKLKNRQYTTESRTKAAGIKPPNKLTPTPPATGPSTLPGISRTIHNPNMSGIVNYKKSEDAEVEKSNYGPKGAGQYSQADNAKRKENNTGDTASLGPNSNIKAYSAKPGQLSGKASADLTARIQAKANKKSPVKQWTPEEIAAENEKRGLKKGWGDHLPFPSAEEEIMKFAEHLAPQGDEALANQLAVMMRSKAMLSNHQQPTKTEFDAAGEAMGLGVTEDMVKAADQQWHGAINNWLAEATKPISQRFSSEKEELEYWNSIKVNGGRDDDSSGY